MDRKEKNSKLSYTMLVFLIGIIVLYPSFVGILVKPNSFEWLLLAFIVFAAIGIIFSFLGYYLNEFTDNTNDKIVGLGNWFSIFAFLFFVLYFSINLYQDKTKKPTIETLTYSPVNVSRGENIELSIKLNDINDNIREYCWTTDSSIINIRPNSKIGLIHIPYNYSKDSINVRLSVYTEKLQIKDSITIYLMNYE